MESGQTVNLGDDGVIRRAYCEPCHRLESDHCAANDDQNPNRGYFYNVRSVFFYDRFLQTVRLTCFPQNK